MPFMTSTHSAPWMMSAASAGRRIHWYWWMAGSAVAEPSVAEAKVMLDAMGSTKELVEAAANGGLPAQQLPSLGYAWLVAQGLNDTFFRVGTGSCQQVASL